MKFQPVPTVADSSLDNAAAVCQGMCVQWSIAGRVVETTNWRLVFLPWLDCTHFHYLITQYLVQYLARDVHLEQAGTLWLDGTFAKLMRQCEGAEKGKAWTKCAFLPYPLDMKSPWSFSASQYLFIAGTGA